MLPYYPYYVIILITEGVGCGFRFIHIEMLVIYTSVYGFMTHF